MVRLELYELPSTSKHIPGLFPTVRAINIHRSILFVLGNSDCFLSLPSSFWKLSRPVTATSCYLFPRIISTTAMADFKLSAQLLGHEADVSIPLNAE